MLLSLKQFAPENRRKPEKGKGRLPSPFFRGRVSFRECTISFIYVGIVS